MTVNYGSPVRFVKFASNDAVGVRAEHLDTTGHDLLKSGEQCECGTLGIGVISQQNKAWSIFRPKGTLFARRVRVYRYTEYGEEYVTHEAWCYTPWGAKRQLKKWGEI